MKKSPGKAVAVRVTGVVQGVGFRYATVHEARRLGITGLVRNSGDGSVEVEAEGDGEAVDAFLVWLRHGPPGAHVRDVAVSERPATGRYDGFSVEY